MEVLISYLTLSNIGWILGVVAGIFAFLGKTQVAKIVAMLKVVIAEIERGKADPEIKEVVEGLTQRIKESLENVDLEKEMNPLVKEVEATLKPKKEASA